MSIFELQTSLFTTLADPYIAPMRRFKKCQPRSGEWLALTVNLGDILSAPWASKSSKWAWQILTGRTRWQGDKVWFAQFARLAPLLWGLILVIIQLLSLGLNRWADVVQTRNRGRTGGIRQAGNGWYDDLMTWKAVFRVQKSGIF